MNGRGVILYSVFMSGLMYVLSMNNDNYRETGLLLHVLCLLYVFICQSEHLKRQAVQKHRFLRRQGARMRSRNHETRHMHDDTHIGIYALLHWRRSPSMPHGDRTSFPTSW